MDSKDEEDGCCEGSTRSRKLSSSSGADTARTELIFTVELAVVARALASIDPTNRQVTDHELSTAPPHWVRRLGHLAPSGRDTWWTIGEAPTEVEEALRWLEAYGFPALRRLSTAEALIQLWESGASPGLTEPQRLVFLSRLAEAKGATAT